MNMFREMSVRRARSATPYLKRSFGLITVLSLASVLCLAPRARAQVDTNAPPLAITDAPASGGVLSEIWNTIAQSGVAKATNYAVEPYATYAPSAPKGSKFGGGLFVAYNINDYVGAGLAADYLGQFSLVSGNVQLKYPTHPFSSLGGFLTNVTVTPFAIAGIGKALSGTGSGAIAVTDVGAYVGMGHLWGGQFNVGGAWGRWDNAGIYSGPRYHIFAGWSRGF